MDRQAEMRDVATCIEKLLREYGKNKEQRGRITINYEQPTLDSLSNYSSFEVIYHHLIPNEEYFLIFYGQQLLYAVNVTGDSILTAGCELMMLVAKKF